MCCAGLLVAAEQAIAGSELFVNKCDNIFEVLEIALVPAADMLNTAAPVFHFHFHMLVFVYNEPQQKGFNPPTAHSRASFVYADQPMSLFLRLIVV